MYSIFFKASEWVIFNFTQSIPTSPWRKKWMKFTPGLTQKKILDYKFWSKLSLQLNQQHIQLKRFFNKIVYYFQQVNWFFAYWLNSTNIWNINYSHKIVVQNLTVKFSMTHADAIFAYIECWPKANCRNPHSMGARAMATFSIFEPLNSLDVST